MNGTFFFVGIGIGFLIVLCWVIFKSRSQLSKSNSEDDTMKTHTGTIFGHSQIPAVRRSEYFPDDLYVGRIGKLDSSLKVMFRNVLFGFPEEPLIVSKFAYFFIDDNPVEEIKFDKIGDKEYLMLYDAYEKEIYFLNRLMTIGVPDGEKPAMVTDDRISFTENNEIYTYNDFSGLIKVKVTSDTDRSFDRLIRVYQREITPDDNEYCIMMMDKPGVVNIYIGFNISIVQFEIA